MTFSDCFSISSKEELIKVIKEMGFVPFFTNEIEGFSIEEHIVPECWYYGLGDGFWPAWEWKGPVIRETGHFVWEFSLQIISERLPTLHQP